jgi:hypothetical protein
MSPSFPYVRELLAGGALKFPAPFHAPCVVVSVPRKLIEFVVAGHWAKAIAVIDEKAVKTT